MSPTFPMPHVTPQPVLMPLAASSAATAQCETCRAAWLSAKAGAGSDAKAAALADTTPRRAAPALPVRFNKRDLDLWIDDVKTGTQATTHDAILARL
jgi:hypothetical protein